MRSQTAECWPSLLAQPNRSTIANMPPPAEGCWGSNPKLEKNASAMACGLAGRIGKIPREPDNRARKLGIGAISLFGAVLPTS